MDPCDVNLFKPGEVEGETSGVPELIAEVEPPQPRLTSAKPQRRLHGKHAVVSSVAAIPALSKVKINAAGSGLEMR